MSTTATPFNQKTIAEFHEKNGRGVGIWGDHLLLMTSVGSATGRRITTPLLHRWDGGRLVVVASKGGTPQDPTWRANVEKNPEVEVEYPVEGGTETVRARATVIPGGPERDRLYEYMTEIWPAFAAYQAKVERIIPVAVLEPVGL